MAGNGCCLRGAGKAGGNRQKCGATLKIMSCKGFNLHQG